MKIYFAGSIRGGREDHAFYLDIIGRLGAYGRVLTEHVGDSELSSFGEDGRDNEIHDRDIAWLREADCLVAEVTTPSLGVGYEIGRALEWGKPILCLFRKSSGRALSAMIAGSGGVKARLRKYGGFRRNIQGVLRGRVKRGEKACGQNKSASSKVATWGARTAVELAQAGTVDVRASAGCPSRDAPAVWQPAPPSDATNYTPSRKNVNDFL